MVQITIIDNQTVIKVDNMEIFISGDFEIKKKDEEEPVIETIYKEIPKIKGDYQLVKGVYLNIPDTGSKD